MRKNEGKTKPAIFLRATKRGCKLSSEKEVLNAQRRRRKGEIWKKKTKNQMKNTKRSTAQNKKVWRCEYRDTEKLGLEKEKPNMKIIKRQNGEGERERVEGERVHS